jgi:hypothetical protein
MWQRWKRLRTGEKWLFGGVILLLVVTVQNYAMLEWMRHSSDKPMFPVRTHYEFVGEGFHGSELFRKNNCTLCHRAIGNGSNMSLNLDGIGSRHDLAYILAFLRDPEATYPTRTVDHGPAPKEASYVAQLPPADLHAIAVFLSQLRTDQGGASAQQPPPGKSDFIDAMLDMWAPDSWRIMFRDVRNGDAGKRVTPPAGAVDPAVTPAVTPKDGGKVAPEGQDQGNGNAK